MDSPLRRRPRQRHGRGNGRHGGSLKKIRILSILVIFKCCYRFQTFLYVSGRFWASGPSFSTGAIHTDMSLQPSSIDDVLHCRSPTLGNIEKCLVSRPEEGTKEDSTSKATTGNIENCMACQPEVGTKDDLTSKATTWKIQKFSFVRSFIH